MSKEWKYSKLIFKLTNQESYPAKYRIIYRKNLINDELSYLSITLYTLIPKYKLDEYNKESGFNFVKLFKNKVLVKTDLHIKNISFLTIFKIGVKHKHFDGVRIEETTEIKNDFYTKEQVIELLHKQRYLCWEEASNNRGNHFVDVEDSILNAKFNLDGEL